MAQEQHRPEETEEQREPRGLGEHTRSRNSENAHEQGWGLNQEERTRLPENRRRYGGGTDYEYGAQDFGDVPEDTSGSKPAQSTLERAEEFRGPKGKEKKGAA